MRLKLNNWLGMIILAAIACIFGYLLATDTIVGMALFALIAGLFIVVLCFTNIVFGFNLLLFVGFFGYFFSDKVALATYSAQPVTPEENPQVYARVFPIVQSLTQRMELPMPKLWLLPDPSPNAFATGRNPAHASVAFTAGILQLMSDQELEGVVAHELGHVKNRDILTSSIAATLAAAITFLARMAFWFGPRGDDEEERGGAFGALAMMILAPLAAMLIQMSISRTREYAADEASANVTRNPGELISALGKLDNWSRRIPMAGATPSTAHLFIVKPFSGSSIMRLFSTHPSTEDRIARLQSWYGHAR